MWICYTFYFRLVLFSVYVRDFMQMYFVRNDEINMFNQSVTSHWVNWVLSLWLRARPSAMSMSINFGWSGYFWIWTLSMLTFEDLCWCCLFCHLSSCCSYLFLCVLASLSHRMNTLYKLLLHGAHYTHAYIFISNTELPDSIISSKFFRVSVAYMLFYPWRVFTSWVSKWIAKEVTMFAYIYRPAFQDISSQLPLPY